MARIFDDVRIFRALAEGLGLRVGGPELAPSLATQVQPTIDIMRFAEEVRGVVPTVNLNTAAFVALLTAPAGYRCYVYTVGIDATTGTHRLAVNQRNAATPPVNVNVFIAASTANEEYVRGSPVAELDPGDSIGVMGTQNVGDASRVGYVHYKRVKVAIVP